MQDLKNRKRTSTRHSLASLKNLQELWKTNGSGGEQTQLDVQDGQGHSPTKSHHHKQRSSRVDVISEKEELVADNSLSN